MKKVEITFFNGLASFHWTLPGNADGFGFVIPKLRENTCIRQNITISENCNKLPVILLIWKVQSTIQITISICFSIFHWKLPKNDDGLRFFVLKVKENTFILYANRFLEAFVKFKQFDSYCYYYRKYIETTVSIFLVNKTFHWANIA